MKTPWVLAIAAAFWRLMELLERERDRRYHEVDIEREKALKIKESADETARILVAENQAYKDEKANELREQISSERGIYATKDEIKPLLGFVNSEQGNRRGIGTSASVLYAVVVVALMVAAFLVARHQPVAPAPASTVTVTVPK